MRAGLAHELEDLGEGRTRLTSRRETPQGISDLSVSLTKVAFGGVDSFTTELEQGMNQTLAKIKADAAAKKTDAATKKAHAAPAATAASSSASTPAAPAAPTPPALPAAAAPGSAAAPAPAATNGGAVRPAT